MIITEGIWKQYECTDCLLEFMVKSDEKHERDGSEGSNCPRCCEFIEDGREKR